MKDRPPTTGRSAGMKQLLSCKAGNSVDAAGMPKGLADN
jgi:hypothetical protein